MTTLYNVQLAEMDLAHAARDFSDAVEVSLRCSEAHENLGASNAAVVGERMALQRFCPSPWQCCFGK